MRRAWLLCAVVLAGCSHQARPQPEPTPSGKPAGGDRKAIGTLLTRRANALEAGDARAYAATSLGAQRAADRRSIGNRRDVALRDVDYEITAADVGRDRAVLRGTESYRVRDGGTFSARRRIVVVKRAGRWRVLAEAMRRDRFPWEVDRYVTTVVPYFTILAPADVDTGALGAALGQARANLTARLTRPRLRSRYLVVVARDPEAVERLTAVIRGTDSLAAITDAKIRDDGPAKQVKDVVSLRLLVVQSAYGALGPADRVQVLTHELTHAALTRVTSGRTPAWLNEGIALYLSGDRRVGQAAELVTDASGDARRALTLTALSTPDAIARLSGDGQSAAYAYASAGAHYVADRFGERRLLRLYQAFNDPRIPGPGGPRTLDAATRRVLRRPLAVLERDLRRWIVTRALVDPLAP